MCSRTLSAVWSLDLCSLPKRQRSTAKIVLARIADRYNPSNGSAWPSMQSLADDCCMSRRSVINQIKALEEAGILIVERRFRNGEQISSAYSFNEEMLFSGELNSLPSELNAPGSELNAHRTVSEPKPNHNKNITDNVNHVEEYSVSELCPESFEHCHEITEAMVRLKEQGERLTVCKLRLEEWENCENLMLDVGMEDHHQFLSDWLEMYGSGFNNKPSLPNIVIEKVNGVEFYQWYGTAMN